MTWLFWDVTRRMSAVIYRRFDITYRPHLQGEGDQDHFHKAETL
jgi:hypothetical protein